jgi:hypothetical protein
MSWNERHAAYLAALGRPHLARILFRLIVLACFAVLVLWAMSGCGRVDDMHYVNDTYQCAGVKLGCFEVTP